MFNNMFFLLFLAETIATDNNELELNYFADLFVPSKTIFKKEFAYEENPSEIFDDVSLSTRDTRADCRSDKSNWNAPSTSNPYQSTFGTYSGQYPSSDSMFSNPYDNSGKVPNQSRNSNAQFSLKTKEFVSDAERRKKEESEKRRREFLANDPRAPYEQKLENIVSEEILQSLQFQRIIDEHVQQQTLEREMEKKRKEALRRKEQAMLDEFWAKWDQKETIDEFWAKGDPEEYLPTPKVHKGIFGLTEVERDANFELVVQKQTPEALIAIISKKYSANSYNPRDKPSEFCIRLSSIQEWFGYEPLLFDGMTEAQYCAKYKYRAGTNMNRDLSDVSAFRKNDDAVRPKALKALSVLVPKWWKNEDKNFDIEYDASWLHWDLTKLLAGRLGIDLNGKPELALCFMIKNFDYDGVRRLIEGFQADQELNKKYGKNEEGKYFWQEARDLLGETKHFW